MQLHALTIDSAVPKETDFLYVLQVPDEESEPAPPRLPPKPARLSIVSDPGSPTVSPNTSPTKPVKPPQLPPRSHCESGSSHAPPNVPPPVSCYGKQFSTFVREHKLIRIFHLKLHFLNVLRRDNDILSYRLPLCTIPGFSYPPLLGVTQPEIAQPLPR